MMETTVGWHIELEFEEDTHRTRAAAMVRLSDGTEVRAHGYASRHPADAEQPRVGEEIMRRPRAQRAGHEAAHQGARRDRRGVRPYVVPADLSTGPAAEAAPPSEGAARTR